jgi:hypothetical protein
MNLTEKVLLEIDYDIEYNENRFSKALRRQVEKHKQVLDTFPYGLELDPPEVSEKYECIMCCTGYYPCTFIKEVATDLGISE